MATPPIILVGTGRCGSTLVHKVMAWHPASAWLSGLANRFPQNPGINAMALRALDVRPLEPALRRYLQPSEAYDFWETHCPGFRKPFRDLRADDLTPGCEGRLARAIGESFPANRDHIVLKVTGWPRIGLFHKLFPNARFVHVVRHPTAVVSSLIATSWWDGWQGPSNWRWGQLSAENSELLARHQQSFVALAAIQWNLTVEATIQAAGLLPAGCFLELRYEDICSDPVGQFGKLTSFSGWTKSERFERRLSSTNFGNTNHKYTTELSPEDQAIVAEITSPLRTEFRYGE